MKIATFRRRGESLEQAWLAELDAALGFEGASISASGVAGPGAYADATGPIAVAVDFDGEPWRLLCADVRGLAPAMSATFERRLEDDVSSWSAPRERDSRAKADDRAASAGGTRRLRAPRSPRALQLTSLAATALAIAAGVVITSPWKSASGRSPTPVVSAGAALNHANGPSESARESRVPLAAAGTEGSAPSGEANGASSGEAAAGGSLGGAAGGSSAAAAGASSAPAAGAAGAGSASSSAGASVQAPAPSSLSAVGAGPLEAAARGRKQHLAATMTLSTAPNDVEAISERVSEVAVSEKGFVASSHVQTGRGKRSEARLSLTVPSAHLSATIASLARLADVREETRSSLDITGAYNSARRGLHDTNAERAALLRALSTATTEGEIDSLRERLAANRRAIARATGRLKAVSTEASTSQLEVGIVAKATAAHDGKSFTLARGLSDAGKVLIVVVSVLLIAAAILVPSAILLAALVAGVGAWRRRLRERALDG